MKKLTIKDFILYNSPCFNCNSSIDFKFGVISDGEDVLNFTENSYLIPNINKHIIELDLQITYSNILKLKIDAKKNKFFSENLRDLTKYFLQHKLFLESSCKNCFSKIRSDVLKFNIDYGFIYPSQTLLEILNFSDKSSVYSIHSYDNKSHIIIKDRFNDSNKPEVLTLPIIRLGKFKNKKDLLNKIKTYILLT